MEKRKIEPNDLYEFPLPYDVTCSPDGKYAAYLFAFLNKEKDCCESELRVLCLETGEEKVLTATRDVGAYKWISSTEIIFSSRRSNPAPGSTDFYILSLEGGEAKKVLSIPRVCTVPEQLKEKEWLILFKAPTDPSEKTADRAEEGKDYWTFTDKPFIRDGEPLGQRRRMQAAIYLEETKEIRRISEKYFEVRGCTTTEDRQKILYFGRNYEDSEPMFDTLVEYDVAEGRNKTLIEGGKLQISLAKYVGEKVILLQASQLKSSATENHDLYLYHRDTGELELMAKPDGMFTTMLDVDSVKTGGQGVKVSGDCLIGAVIRGCRTVFDEVNVTTKTIRTIASVDAFMSLDVFGDKIYTFALENYQLTELYRIDRKSGQKEKLTDFSSDYMGTHKVSLPEKLTFFASNGEEVDGFVIPPVDEDKTKKYPAVLLIHGGPKWAYGSMFTHLKQCLAARGMYVIYCNPHGGDGKGNSFLEMVDRWGCEDYDQIMEFTDECIRLYPGIDENRLGVAGGSYGGYMTNWIIGHTDRFKAAVTQRGICNLTTEGLISDFGDRVMKQSSGDKTPWNKEEALWDHSPLKYVKNVKTPTLIMHSDRDYRCPEIEAFQMFTALKQTGVDTEMILFHGDSHGLSRNGKPSHRIVRINAIIDWMGKYL